MTMIKTGVFDKVDVRARTVVPVKGKKQSAHPLHTLGAGRCPVAPSQQVNNGDRLF